MSQSAMLIRRLSKLASLSAIGLFVALGLPASTASGDPVVSISSPAPGTTVEGTITISATATADSGDYPTQITVYDGVNEINQIGCQGQQTCAGTVQWNATGLSGQHELTATVDTNNGLRATSAPVDVTVVSPPPTVSITSPVAGSTIDGTVTIAVTGATDPSLSDYPTQITVYDGVNEINQIGCQGQQTCAGTVQWNATGLSGQHELTATVDTNNGLSATSAPVDVTVVSPPPTVAITSPKAGSLVAGTVMVAASGATDPNQSDYPTQITVNDGTNQIGQISCQGQQTCVGTVQWDTSGLSGRQALTAVINTNRGLSATSPVDVVTVAVYTKPIVTVSRPGIVQSGRHLTVSGLVRATAPGPALKGIRVRATYLPSTGGPQTAVTETSASGTYSVQFRAVANGEVTIATGASGFYRASSARVTVTVDASVTCQLPLKHIALDQSDPGVCTARGEPTGAPATIQYRQAKGGWSNVVKGQVNKAGQFHFVLIGSQSGTYNLRVLIGANSRFGLSTADIGTLTVG